MFLAKVFWLVCNLAILSDVHLAVIVKLLTC